jgi:hypothetical protein
MERTLLYMEDYLRKWNEEMARHPEFIPGMKVRVVLPRLGYGYSKEDPTRDPNNPGTPEEQAQADRVFEESKAKVDEKYQLIHVS